MLIFQLQTLRNYHAFSLWQFVQWTVKQKEYPSRYDSILLFSLNARMKGKYVISLVRKDWGHRRECCSQERAEKGRGSCSPVLGFIGVFHAVLRRAINVISFNALWPHASAFFAGWSRCLSDVRANTFLPSTSGCLLNKFRDDGTF